MSFTKGQIITVSLAGLATAVGVAAATIQSGTMKQSHPPLTESPASTRNQIAAPTNNPESRQPEPLQAQTQAAESPKSQPQPAKTPAVQSSLVAGVSGRKVRPVVVTPPNSGCKISQAVVSDQNPPLNVRSIPQVRGSNIVGKLKNNTFVSVAEEQNGWLRITDPVPGWVAKRRTESSCSNINQQINFRPGGDEAIVKGRIIGGGSHSYRIRARKGQTMTVRNRQEVFPQIITPRGKLLAGDPYQDNETEWTGKMPVTGNYTLQLHSNFRGYEYEFSVKLR
ncbi:SH3 domain-containing protein [Microcoleus vaginatus]|uniref:SH3 domain-containing protein n=1 Tax=Microcoleus vaginatus TaxID=119532 RepID=UPI001F61243C|nr:SH3 domain-containing protein [Microcoleus vaginatus HSN003]